MGSFTKIKPTPAAAKTVHPSGTFTRLRTGETVSFPKTQEAPTAGKAKRQTATAANKAPAGRAEAMYQELAATRQESQLKERARQARADLDTDTLNQVNRQLKELRAAQGKQTLGDRASDTLSAVFSGSAGSLTNAAGLAMNLFQDPETDRRSAERAREALRTGRTSDGRSISEAQRKNLQESVSRHEKQAARRESPESAVSRLYSAADRMQGDSARFQGQATKGLGAVGSTVVDAATSMGQSLLDVGLGAATGTGMAPFVVRSLGGAVQEARQGGADLDQQLLYGSAQAAKEFVTEKLFGLAVPQKALGKAGTGSLDDAIEKGIRNVTERLAQTEAGKKALGGALTWLGSGVTEGLEEGIGALIENTLINPNLRKWNPDTRTAQEKFEDGLYDMLVGGVSGLMGVTNLFGYQPSVTKSPSSQAGRGLRATRAAGESTDTARARSASFYLPDKQEKDIPALGERETAPETGAAVNENGLISLTELEKTNLSSGKKNKIVSTFQEAVGFIRNALADRQNVDRAYLGKVPQATADRVLRETGIDISGYNAILPGDVVRHMFKNHGAPMSEAARGQVALTPEAAANIAKVISNPDKVYLSGDVDARGLRTLMFEKSIGDYYITAQAISDGTHSIQTDTMYIQKKKSPQGTVSNTSGSPDPKHNVQNVPPQSPSTFNIIQGAASVNPGDDGLDGLGGGGPGINPFYFSDLGRSLAAALPR